MRIVGERLSQIMDELKEKHGQATEKPVNYEQYRCDFANNNPGNLNEVDGHNCEECKNKGIVYFVKKDELTGWETMTARECKCKS